MLRIGAVVAVALGLIDAATGFKGHATAALRVRARLVCRRPVALSHLRCGVDRGDFRCGKASSLSETSPEAAPPSLPRVPNVCSLFLLHGIVRGMAAMFPDYATLLTAMISYIVEFLTAASLLQKGHTNA